MRVMKPTIEIDWNPIGPKKAIIVIIDAETGNSYYREAIDIPSEILRMSLENYVAEANVAEAEDDEDDRA